MHCRVMKKEEFVERMLAEQELRKERKRRADFEAADVMGSIIYKRQAKALRDKKHKR